MLGVGLDRIVVIVKLLRTVAYVMVLSCDHMGTQYVQFIAGNSCF